MKRLQIVLLLASSSTFVTFVTFGCKKADQALAQKGHETAQGTEPQAAADATQAALGLYNKGFNLLLDDPQRMLEEYYSKVPKDGPVPGETYALIGKHTFAESDVADLQSAFEQGAKSAPESLKHLGPLASACATDAQRMVGAFKAAHDYWDSDQAKADKGKKGKALHTDFVTAAEAYRANLQKFEAALSTIEDRQMAEELRQHETKKGYGYWFRFHNRHANKLLKADKAGYPVAFAELERAHTGLVAFAGAKPDAHAVFKTYRSQADAFFSQAQKLGRIHEAAKVDAEAVAAANNELIDAYNAMIEVTNSLRELEANGLLRE